MNKETLDKANELKISIDGLSEFIKYFGVKKCGKFLKIKKIRTSLYSPHSPSIDIRELNIDGELGEKIYNLLCDYKSDLEHQFKNLK